MYQCERMVGALLYESQERSRSSHARVARGHTPTTVIILHYIGFLPPNPLARGLSDILESSAVHPSSRGRSLHSQMVRSGLGQRIGVAEALSGLDVWILPNALRSPEKHHDAKSAR